MDTTKAWTIPSTFTTTFEMDYSVGAMDLRRLYENAKRDQWNASRDIPWDAPGSPDGRIIADELVDIYGSPLWDALSEHDKVALNRRIAAWRLGTLMYGEQGALLACSQLVDVVTGTDAKFFQATQVMDGRATTRCSSGTWPSGSTISPTRCRRIPWTSSNRSSARAAGT